MNFFDRFKPTPQVQEQPPVPYKVEPVISPLVVPEAQIVSPTPESTKPLIDLSFSSVAGMGFAVEGLDRARKYTEVLGDKKPEGFDKKMAAFIEIMGVLDRDAKDERDVKEAEEKSKCPIELFKGMLIKSVSSPNSALNEYTIKSISQGADIGFSSLQKAFNDEKLSSGQTDANEIIKNLFAQGKVATYFDLLSVRHSQSPHSLNTESVHILKTWDVIPSDSPDTGQLPEGLENYALSKLFQQDGKATPTETVVSLDNKNEPVTEFTKPTKIDGVNITVGFKSSDLSGNKAYNGSGYPTFATFKFGFTPEFYAKSLGI